MGAVPPNPTKVVPCRAVFLLCQGARRDKGLRRSRRRLDLFSSPPVRSSSAAKPPLRYASPLRSPSLGALLNKRKAPCQSICSVFVVRRGSVPVRSLLAFSLGGVSCVVFPVFFFCFSVGLVAVSRLAVRRRLALRCFRGVRLLAWRCRRRGSAGFVRLVVVGFRRAPSAPVRSVSSSGGCRVAAWLSALGSFRCRRRRRSSLCAVGGRRGGSACLPRLFPAGCGWSAPVPFFLPSSVVAPAFCCSRGSVFRAFVAAAAGFRCFRRLSAARQRSKPYERRYKK